MLHAETSNAADERDIERPPHTASNARDASATSFRRMPDARGRPGFRDTIAFYVTRHAAISAIISYTFRRHRRHLFRPATSESIFNRVIWLSLSPPPLSACFTLLLLASPLISRFSSFTCTAHFHDATQSRPMQLAFMSVLMTPESRRLYDICSDIAISLPPR